MLQGWKVYDTKVEICGYFYYESKGANSVEYENHVKKGKKWKEMHIPRCVRAKNMNPSFCWGEKHLGGLYHTPYSSFFSYIFTSSKPKTNLIWSKAFAIVYHFFQ